MKTGSTSRVKASSVAGPGYILRQLRIVREGLDAMHGMLNDEEGDPAPETIARTYAGAMLALRRAKEEAQACAEDEGRAAARGSAVAG